MLVNSSYFFKIVLSRQRNVLSTIMMILHFCYSYCLSCESIGSTDMKVLGEHLKDNTCLAELCIANNQLRNADVFVKGLSTWMHVRKKKTPTLN